MHEEDALKRAFSYASLCARTRGDALVVGVAVLIALHGGAVADSVRASDDAGAFLGVRQKADSEAPIIAKLKKGELAKMIGTTKYWRHVELADGKKGFVSKRWTVVVRDPSVPAGGDLVVTFIDIDEGDAILLRFGDVDLLVDAGKENAWKLSLDAVLTSVRGPLEALIITHPHTDHFGGAADVLANLDVKKVYTNGERRGPPRDVNSLENWDDFEQAVAAEGLTIRTLKVGEALTPAPGLTVEVLATGSPAGGQFKDTPSGTNINNDSLVLMVEYAGRRLLLTGDIEIKAGKNLVEAHCENHDPETCPKLHADVLKVPHHGSANFDGGFFKAVSPAWAVTSAAYKSTAHCLPRNEPNDALLALGAKLISTSADGREHVTLTISNTGEMNWTMPTKEIFAWRKRRVLRTKCDVTAQYEQGQ